MVDLEFMEEDELPEEETISDTELEHLELLAHSFGRVEYRDQKFLVSVEINADYALFHATSLHDGHNSSFSCQRSKKSIFLLDGCDASWVRNFLGKYKMLDD